MNEYDRIIIENKAWVQEHKDIILKNKHVETKFFFLGCSDSQFHESKFPTSQLDSIYMHRNFANLVIENDLNLMSSLEYSLYELKVEEFIICGHAWCHGIGFAMKDIHFEKTDLWICQIRELYESNRDEINKEKDEIRKQQKLIELNVINQVENFSNLEILKKFKKSHKDIKLSIHGWVLLETGLIKELKTIEK